MLERLADKAIARPAARWLLPVERGGAPHIENLPADFEDNRDVHYENLRQSLDAAEFIVAIGC